MLPFATPSIHAQVDPYEQLERDSLRATARPRLGSPGPVGRPDRAGVVRGRGGDAVALAAGAAVPPDPLA
jgi:hypothetical protein